MFRISLCASIFVVIVAAACTEPPALVAEPEPELVRAAWWFPDANAPSDTPTRAVLKRYVEAHEGAPVDVRPAIELSEASDSVTMKLARADGSLLGADIERTLGGRGLRLTPRAPLVVGNEYVVTVEGERFATHTFTFMVTQAPSLDVERIYPSAFAVDAEGRPLPPPHADGPIDSAQVHQAVAELSGFSTSARIQIPLGARADDTGGFTLFRVEGDEAIEIDNIERSITPRGDHIYLKRKPALAPATRYFVAVTDDARSGNRSFAPSLEAALLSSSEALLNATPVVTDADAARLEPIRSQLAPLFAARDDVVAAVPFDTLDAFAFVDKHAREAEERGIDPELHDVLIASPWDRGLWALMPNVETVVSGTFTGLDFLDPVTLRKAPDGPRTFDIPFVLTVPENAGEGPVPVVVFGHGLITAKELAYLMADLLAEHGFATFAIDLPMHGERTPCLFDVHCELFQTCTENHQCVRSDGSPGELAAGESLWEGGPRIPLATGEAFVSVDDLVASRDHFLQGIVDLRQALRLLQADTLDDELSVDVSSSDFSWLGISLGGIFGAAMSGSSDLIKSFALNVPGADLVVTLEDSTVLSPILAQMLARTNIERGSEAFMMYEDVAHHVLDPVDPLNLAPRSTWNRPDTWSEKRILIQMAEADAVVPNSATRILSEAIDREIVEYHALVSNHGFLVDPTSFEGERARDDVIEFLLTR